MNSKIYIQQWLELKPYETQTLSDSYYLKLANKIKSSISGDNSLILHKYLGDDELDLLYCFLTAYFEDVISETNIWNTFIKTHYKLYNKRLPFFNTDEYFDGEINEQDISFLIWYFLNTIQEDKFISPKNSFFFDISSVVFEIFDIEYETAPENKLLQTFYAVDENESNFYLIRQFIETILSETYLFYPDTALKLKLETLKTIEEKKENEHLLMYLRDITDSFIHSSHTRLLSLKGKEWAAELLGAEHPLSTDLLKMSQRISGLFLYKGQNNLDISLEHIATGKEFKLTKKSYDNHPDLVKIDSILFLSIVRWQNEWWFSGVSSQFDFDANIVLDERNSTESRMQVNFLDHDSVETEQVLKNHYDGFFEFNNGSQIVFLPSDEIEQFYKKFMDYLNSLLNLSKEERKKAKKRLKKVGFFGGEHKDKIDFSEINDSGLVFYNPKSGIEIALDVNSAFPMKSNTFYNQENSEANLFHLLMSNNMSTELAMYCIDNCKNKLPFFSSDIGKLFLEDIDFLLRFWKNETYKTVPALTMI